jgi:DNA repair exonuclease SbcCD ATPase subunit
MSKSKVLVGLINHKDFNLDVTDVKISGEGDSWELQVTVNNHTTTYAYKSLNACKSKFTREFGKGANWGSSEDLPTEEKPKAKRGRPSKKKEEPKTEPASEMDMSSFEVEPDASEEKAKNLPKKEPAKAVEPVKTEDPVGMEVFNDRMVSLMEGSKSVVLIENDEQNEQAREKAKALRDLRKEIDEARKDANRPLDKAIKSNNALAKTMTEPIDKEIERMKLTIGAYETQKEKERQAELERIEKEKKEQEEAQQAEAKRIERIKGSIEKMDTDLSGKIENARSIAALDKMKQSLSDWTPKKEYYMEFLPEVEQLVKTLHEKIDARYEVVRALEAAKSEGNAEVAQQAEEALQNIASKEAAQEEVKKEGEETDEFRARQQLITLLGQMGVEDISSAVEQVIQAYGSAENAIANKEQMIAAYKQNMEAAEKEQELKSGGMKNQRVKFTFEVVDKTKIPLEYLMVDEAKIRTDIKTNSAKLREDLESFKIDGVVIKKELQTVLK